MTFQTGSASYKDNFHTEGMRSVQFFFFSLLNELPYFFLQGPEVLSSCGNLSLSGSQSYGGGGRPLNFKWSVTSPDDNDVTDIKSVLDALSSDDDSVKIYGGLLESGKTYMFHLEVANFLNRGDNHTHKVTKNSDPVPALTLSSSIDLIDGEVYVSEDFSIKTNAIVSKSMMFTLKAVNSSSPSSSSSFFFTLPPHLPLSSFPLSYFRILLVLFLHSPFFPSKSSIFLSFPPHFPPILCIPFLLLLPSPIYTIVNEFHYQVYVRANNIFHFFFYKHFFNRFY